VSAPASVQGPGLLDELFQSGDARHSRPRARPGRRMLTRGHRTITTSVDVKLRLQQPATDCQFGAENGGLGVTAQVGIEKGAEPSEEVGCGVEHHRSI
jgi:hypothetical protein